jgi:hypothetical protein
MKSIIATTACCLLGTSAHGANSGFYFGVLAGTADYEFQSPPLTAVNGGDVIAAVSDIPSTVVVPDDGFAAFSPAGWLPGDDDRSTAWGVAVGYRIFRYAAVELSYLDFGVLEESDTPNINLPHPPTVPLRRELETTGPTFSVLGTLPIVGGWSLYARAGVLFTNQDFDTWVTAPSGDKSVTSQDALWGAGTQIDWGEHWSVRLDFQRFEGVGEMPDAGEADIDLLTLGVLYRL